MLVCQWGGKWGGSVVGPSDPALHPPQAATSVPKFHCIINPQDQLGPYRPSGLRSDPVVRHLGLPIDNLMSEQLSKLEFLA